MINGKKQLKPQWSFDYEADGIVVGSPVYYAEPSGSLLSFLDRLFYSYPHKKSLNVNHPQAKDL